ncbi:MAG: imidazole glycerol phosphate synthase subunit HisH [Bacteroidia bacterium]|nr:imidazole glycerol phosphate synthase subunit HisH [Bacteroidia bacterium]
MQEKVVIIDYGMGNLRSVYNKLIKLNADVLVSSSVDDIEKAAKLILPGVGHFLKGMKNLREYKILDILKKRVLEDKVPILGICLGMQLFAKHSQEGDVEGLGWLDADVVRFRIKDKLRFKIPHIGWNSVTLNKNISMFDNINALSLYYFVHSYHIVCNNSDDILTTTEYEYEFTSGVIKDNIIGLQFHPEKSQAQGAKIIGNFLKFY